MRIIQRYLLKEFFGLFITVAIALSFVMLLGSLLKLADLVINKGVELLSILKLLIFNLPYLWRYILPISVLTASLMSLGRLSHDNEITALKASGINIINLLSPFWILGIIFTLTLIIFNDRIAAYAHYATKKTLTEIGIKNPATAIEPGVFINSFPGYIIFVYEAKQNKLSHIRIYELQNSHKLARTIIAKKGEFVSIPEKRIVKLKLIDGSMDELDPKNPEQFYRLSFKNYFITLNLTATQDKEDIQKKPKDMSLKELKQAQQDFKEKGLPNSIFSLHIQERLALSFSALVFMVLGCSLGLLIRKRQKAINFGIAFVIIGIYYLIMLLGKSLCLETNFPYVLGMWLANIVFGIIGIIITYKTI